MPKRKGKSRGKGNGMTIRRGKKNVRLTPRQMEIVRLASLGCSVNEMALVLDIAPSTVDNHKASAMARLGTDKLALLTRVALSLGVTSMKDRLTPSERRKSGRDHDGWN